MEAFASVSRVVPHLCGLPTHIRRSQLLAMLNLRIFADESEIQKGQREVFSLGGWIADVETWERFSDDWNGVLAKPPAIVYFKHHEAKSLCGQFLDWRPQDADLKILSLAEVIDRHIDPKRQQYGVLTGMRPEVLRKILKESPATRKQIKSVLKVVSCYDFCFHSLVGMVLRHQFSLKTGQVVDFIFDAHSSFDDCVKLYRKMKKEMPAELAAIAGTVIEGDDKKLAPLQAADLLVGQLGANLRNGSPEEPFKLLNRVPRILFSPLRWKEDAVLTGFASTLEVFNLFWSSLMIEKASKKRRVG